MSNLNFSIYQSKRLHSPLLPSERQVAGNSSNINYKRFLVLDSALPLLPVPQKLWRIWKDSAIIFKPEILSSVSVLPYQRAPIMVPKIDEIGTEFMKEEMPIQYTIWNMLFISERTGTKSQSQETDAYKLSYALDILKAIGKESAGEVTAEYSKQFQTTMSFFIENSKTLWQLEDKSTRNNESYKDKIAAVEYDDNEVGKPTGSDFISQLRRENPIKPAAEKKMVKVGDELAQGFMKRINDDITFHLKKHFDGLANQMPKREIKAK